MADYSIELGVKLNTKDIDTQINTYNNKKNLIKVQADFDPTDITNTLNSFKGKAIDINSNLSTKGITEAIRNYNSDKKNHKIYIKSEFNTDDIDDKINNYVPSKTINVDVELNKKSINHQIQNASPSEYLTVKAKLDDDAITEAINGYKTAKPIPIKVQPDFSELNFNKVEELLDNYEPKTQLKVKVSLNKNEINKQISEFNQSIESGDESKRKVLLRAEFRSDAIDNAISSFKMANADKLKIPMDITFDSNTELDAALNQKVESYKNNPMSIPVTLRPAEKNFISKSLGTTSIPIEATLKNPKAINDEIYKHIQSPVLVPVKLKPADKGFDSKITSKSIPVHVELIPEEINSVITNFKPTSKIPVDVELNKQGINTEVSKLPKPTQPLEVDVELNQTSINNGIANAKTTSLLKVNVDLQTEDINSQIEAIHPTSKVNVNLDLADNVGEEIRRQSGQNPIEVNVRLDREDLNKQIREFKTNTKIKVGVKLDFASHEGGQVGVPQQIKNYKTNTKIKVGVQIDRNSVNQALQGVNVTAPMPIGIELEPNSVQRVQNQINNIRQQIAALGNIRIDFGGNTRGRSIGATTGAYNRAFREVFNLYKQIENMEEKLGKLGSSGIDADNLILYRQQLEQLRRTYDAVFRNLSSDNIDLDLAFADIDRAKTSMAELSSVIDNVRTKSAEKIKIDINRGNLKAEIDSIENDFNKLEIESQQVTNNIGELRRLLSNMDASDDIESVNNDYREFERILDTTKNRVKELKVEMNSLHSDESFGLKRQDAMLKLNSMFEEGSQASKKFGARARELANELNNCGNANLDNVIKKVNILGREVKDSHLQTQTWSSRIKEQFTKYRDYISIASVFMYGMQAARSMFEQVKLIDSAMTELKKVTDETDESYDKFLSNAATRAREIGTTIDGLISSTSDFARLGYSFEESQGLAEVANIYAVVGDEIEGVEGATESLISTMAAFKDQAEGVGNSDFAMSIIDKFNEIGNKFAISSGGIGEAMMRSASSLDAANNSIDESIALITAANTVVGFVPRNIVICLLVDNYISQRVRLHQRLRKD